MKVDLSGSRSEHSFCNKAGRALWGMVWLLLFRPSFRCAHAWRRFLLRLFGARMGRGVLVYPSCRVWAPWNLSMGDYSRMGEYVDCYCVDKVYIGAHATVSQYSYLCAATHDISDPEMGLVTDPVVIGEGAWICAGVFVGPGVKVGEGAVAGACSVVVKDVPDWMVVGGNPARIISSRSLRAGSRPGAGGAEQGEKCRGT